jgi:hypothetical protein
VSIADCLKSRYLLHHALLDAGVDAFRAVLAADVLLGPEPAEEDDVVGAPLEFEPAPADRVWLATHPALPPICGVAPDDGPDWDEYSRWSAWQDALEASHPRYGEDDARAAGLAVG